MYTNTQMITATERNCVWKKRGHTQRDYRDRKRVFVVQTIKTLSDEEFGHFTGGVRSATQHYPPAISSSCHHLNVSFS